MLGLDDAITYLNSTLGKYLFLPLTAFIVWLFALYQRSDGGAFWLNMFTEALGIFVTVFVIERILSYHRAEKEKEVRTRARQHVKEFYGACHARIRRAVGRDLEFANQLSLLPEFSNWVERIEETRRTCGAEEMIAMQHANGMDATFESKGFDFIPKFANEKVRPNLRNDILALDSDGWRELMELVSSVETKIDELMSWSAAYLSPKQYAIVFDLKKTLDRIRGQYEVLPGLIGKDAFDGPAVADLDDGKKAQLSKVQQSICLNTVHNLSDMLDLLSELRSTL